MRIAGSTAPARSTTSGGPRRAAAGGFSVTAEQGARSIGATTALQSVGGIDMLIALQGMEGPLERRQRGVKRGRSALDVLDELKIGLLGDTLDHSVLLRLKASAAGLKEESGDPGLDAVLSEIDLRVEVELAKAGIR
jgi:hypothetical protein